MTSNGLKRRVCCGENDHESKRSKKMYGDGVSWIRGAMIGQGSFGRVFMAKLKNTGSRYSLYPPVMAVKSAGVSASDSIQNEKEVLDNIRGCPYVITCFGDEITTGDDGQMVYNLLLEYGSGGTLGDLIRNAAGRGLPEVEVRRYARSILRGLSHIHKKGYVHCDMKPQNVLLVASEGRSGGFIAKIVDFGLSKRTKKKNNKNSYTGTGTDTGNSTTPCWRGTPMYLSPEAVINGVQEQPADIWAVGCIVFEMLIGKPMWFSNQDLGIDGFLNGIGDEIISAEGRSFLKKCLCKKVMCRLSANMLLQHPFLKGLVEDDCVIEAEESRDVFDINTITSLSSFDDD